MPLGQTLRYYRGQFNPEAAYQQQGGGSDVISMYNPEAQGQFIDAVMKHQERFDAGKMAKATEIARIGEMETYDLKELNNRLTSLETGINSLVKDKYNGDYGAAANEIAKQISIERSNPFYHFNKQKVEMGKAYLDTKMKMGANFIETSSPFDVNFQDWQQGKTFEFSPINRNDIVQNSASTFGTLAKTLMATPDVQLAADERLLKITIQKGLRDPQAVRNFLQTPAGQIMYNEVYNSMPELANVKDPSQVEDAIIQGAYAAIGGTDVNFTGNPGYIDPMEQAKLAGLGASREGLVGTGFTEAPSNLNDILSSSMFSEIKDPIAIEEAKKAGIPNINSYADLLAYQDENSSLLGRVPFGKREEFNMVKDAMKNVENRVEEILKTDSQMFAFPTYDFNTLAPMDSGERNDLESIKKNLNDHVNNPASLAANDIVGVTEQDSKKLKDLNEKEIKGFFFIPTNDPNNPLQIGLQLTGTKGTGAKKENIQTKALINSTSTIDQNYILEFLARIDSRVFNDWLKQKEKIMGTETFNKWLKENGINREE